MGKILNFFRKNEPEQPEGLVCTYCGGTKWYEGPSGGMCINILCANPECRHWFNDTGYFGLQDLERIEPRDSFPKEKRITTLPQYHDEE